MIANKETKDAMVEETNEAIKKAKIDKKVLKIIMTDLAAGHITKKEADSLLKGEKVAESKPVKEIKEKKKKDQTHKRKKSSKSREVK